MKHLIGQITTYLHETGRVLWFADHPKLRSFIILRPTWFSDLVKAVFRHDISSLDFSHDEAVKTWVSQLSLFYRFSLILLTS